MAEEQQELGGPGAPPKPPKIPNPSDTKSHESAIRSFFGLFAFQGKAPDESLVYKWASVLGDLPLEQVKEALVELAKSWTKAGFPRPGHVRELIGKRKEAKKIDDRHERELAVYRAMYAEAMRDRAAVLRMFAAQHEIRPLIRRYCPTWNGFSLFHFEGVYAQWKRRPDEFEWESERERRTFEELAVGFLEATRDVENIDVGWCGEVLLRPIRTTPRQREAHRTPWHGPPACDGTQGALG